MKSRPKRKAICQSQNGVTLIELMVALVIGMLITLAATSGVSFFESMRRSSIGSGSALENGIAASFNVQRKVQGSGLWAVNGPCTKLWKYNYTSSAWESNSDLSISGTLGAPVELASDTSITTSSDSVTTRSVSSLISAPVTLTASSNGATAVTSSGSGFKSGNLVLIRPPANDSSECYLALVTQVSGNTLSLTPFVTGSSVTTLPAAYGIGSQVYNMGNIDNTLFRVTNSFGTKTLDVFESVDLGIDADGDTNRNGSTTVLAENIVQMRAQYGMSSSSTSLSIDHWINPGSTAPADRLRAIRLAIISRSQQANFKDKDGTGSCTTTMASPAIPWTIGTNDEQPRALDLGLSGNPERKCYEYRVTSIVVPLKNYMFSGGGGA